MGDLLSGLARMGIVRVLFVPTVMGLIMYGLWILAAPKNHEDDNRAQS